MQKSSQVPSAHFKLHPDPNKLALICQLLGLQRFQQVKRLLFFPHVSLSGALTILQIVMLLKTEYIFKPTFFMGEMIIKTIQLEGTSFLDQLTKPTLAQITIQIVRMVPKDVIQSIHSLYWISIGGGTA